MILKESLVYSIISPLLVKGKGWEYIKTNCRRQGIDQEDDDDDDADDDDDDDDDYIIMMMTTLSWWWLH